MAHDTSFRIRRANRDHWFEFRIGRSGVVISATISTQQKRIGVEIYLGNDYAKLWFKQLLDQRTAIEHEFGEILDWQELPTKKACRIAIFKQGVNPADSAQYSVMFDWMLMRMQRYKMVFAERVRLLSSADELPVSDGEVTD